MLGAMGQMTSKIAFYAAEKNANMALKLDYNLADAHVSKSLVAIFKDWDLETAKRHIEKAVELSPGSGSVRHAYYLYFICIQNYDRALEEIQLAIKLDPFSLPINTALGELYIYTKEFDKSIDHLNKTIALDPSFRSAIHTKGFAYLFKGEYDKAIETYNTYRKLLDDPLKGVTGLGATYGMMGNHEKAQECLSVLDERVKRDSNLSLNGDYIVIYNAMGDFDKVFEHLEDSMKKEESIFFIIINPFFEKLRREERYLGFIEKHFNK